MVNFFGLLIVVFLGGVGAEEVAENEALRWRRKIGN